MVAKTQPFSLRLSPRLDALVTAEAKRTHRSKGSILEGLADEALRTRRFPGIAFRGADWERRPWVIGTALDVWEIMRAHRHFESVERMHAETDLAERHIRLALAYYEAFPDEINEALADADRSLEELHALYPWIQIHVVST